MIAIILAILAILGAWAAFFYLNLPLPLTILASIGAVLSAAGWIVGRMLKARAAAKALDQTLNAQAEAQEKNARPDMQPEVQEMRAEFAKALASLKSSKLARTGADALSILPWYVIIGPPGAGKSTALRNSGLKFPYLSKRGGIRGVGGTRNCDWWLTNEGVILDTAGRYTTEDDDRDEWLAFLDALAKARPRRPVNGLIVAVSVSELLDTDEQGAADLGQRLRERVDEVTGRLKLLVPVYVLLTKCDLLAGFVETFNDLPKSERSQVWGFTFPVGTVHADGPAELVRNRFDELTAVLEERMLRRIAAERRPDLRERILQFPRQFEALRSNLAELTQALCSENPYQDTPLLRGVYFTSGTQEGRAIDKVMSAMASAFGIKSALPQSSEPVTDARSYFLGELFTGIIFKDQKLATRSSAALHRQKQLRYVYTAGAGVLAALLVLLPAISFSKNRDNARQLAERVKAEEEARSLEDRLARLKPLYDLIEQLRKEDASASTGFGMYRGDQLLNAVYPVYGTWVRRLIAPVLDADRVQMKAALTKTRGKPALKLDDAVLFEKLRRQVLLSLQNTEPPSDPGHYDRDQLASLSPALAIDWAKTERRVPQQEDMDRHLTLMFSVWPEYADKLRWKIDRDAALVADARSALAGMDRSRQMMEAKLLEWGKGYPEVNMALLVSDGSVYGSERYVRPAFTKVVWSERVKGQLDQKLEDKDGWILGPAASADAQTEEKRKQAYYGLYVSEWDGFLNSIKFKPPGDKDDVLRRLKSLASTSGSPLDELFGRLSEYLPLESNFNPLSRPLMTDPKVVDYTFGPLLDLAPSALGSAVKGALKKVENKAAGALKKGGGAKVSLEKYRTKMDELYKELSDADGEKVAALAGKFRSEANSLRLTLEEESSALARSVLTNLLVRPLEQMADALDHGKRQGINLDWCSSVYTPYRSSIGTQYPFNPKGRDALLDDFKAMFQPKGNIDAFYAEKLKGVVGNNGKKYTFLSEQQTYLPALLEYLAKAKSISDALFPNNAPEPVFNFRVKLALPQAGYKKTILMVDGQRVEQGTYKEVEQALRWPGDPKGPKGASIVLEKSSGQQEKIVCQNCEGDWGFFRLLEQGKVLPRNAPKVFKEVWTSPSGAEVPIEFSWSQAASPFFGLQDDGHSTNLFAIFRRADPPATIVRGGGDCN